MDQHRLDPRGGHRLEELRVVVLAVGGRPPHPRRLIEDLDRLAAPLDATFDRVREATRLGHVGAD